jgi:sugar lactone lactonase YvrE
LKFDLKYNFFERFPMSTSRHLKVAMFAFSMALIPAFVCPMNAQPSYPAPSEGLPNGYRAMPNWAKAPDGRQWGSTSGVAMAPDGHVWALDRCGRDEHGCEGSKLDPIVELDQSGKPIKRFGAGMFNSPHGLYVDKDGNVWVTDNQVSEDKKIGLQVFKFSPSGKVLMKLGKAGVSGEGPDMFASPTNVVVGANGDIFVEDGHDACKCSNRRIVKYNKDGKFIMAWGKQGSGLNEFGGLHGLTMDSQGRLFVADRTNSRIQIFSQDGKLLATWEQFGRPSAMAIDQGDNLYVSDSQGPLLADPKVKRGIRIGSAKDGMVRAFVPDPRSTVEGLAVDRQGVLFGAENGNLHSETDHGTLGIKKYVKE